MAPWSQFNSTVEVLEPSEKRLLDRYWEAVHSTPRLQESEKLLLVTEVSSNPEARRRLVEHYLPLAMELALRVSGGALLQKIQAGNRGLIACFQRCEIDPRDDMDFIVARWIRSSIEKETA